MVGTSEYLSEACELTWTLVLFPVTGHRLSSYSVEGHAIADIKVNTSVSTSTQQQRPPPLPAHPSYSQYASNQQPPAPPNVQRAHEPFVDPAILSVGKRTSIAPTPNQSLAGPPQEAPATPIKPLSVATVTPLTKHTSPFVARTKERNIRKPSAATLEGPFSSLDIADAEELESDENKTVQVAVRRVSLTKTRTGKPMDEPSVQAAIKNEESNKRTRRGGKARKKEVAALERRNGEGLHSSPDAVRKA
jgi:enhancer of mRNA-decapping protein 3